MPLGEMLVVSPQEAALSALALEEERTVDLERRQLWELLQLRCLARGHAALEVAANRAL